MDLPATALSLPRGLSYPITIQRIHAQIGTRVRKTDTLLTYSFVPHLPDDDGNRVRQVRQWESPIEGDVHQWHVHPGDLVRDNSQPVVHIKEPCTHDVQLQGLCALCGKDLTAVDYTGFSDTSRATISMVHDVGGLTVSLDEAARLESATTTRLLNAKKLSLIVDLDQTIVHATVEPTVHEWMHDPTNPNFAALEGVKRFKLLDEAPARGGGGRRRKTNRPEKAEKRKRPVREGDGEEEEERGGAGEDADDESSEDDDEDGCWYYIKMRPGLPDFLKRVSEMYEMHVYTMGTRAYAKEVCRVIDPDGGLFGGRILSRDESGSLTRKSLQRLFPCDTNMVVIIDDRADVWDGSSHLVKVIPYEFFVGIGDINAAFLPKKKELVPPPPAPAPSPSPAASPASASPSASPADSSPSPNASPDPTRPRRTTTPSTSPPPPHAAHSSLPEAITPEPTTVSDLLVEPSPAGEADSVVVAPALDEASSVALGAVRDVIEARPLEKIAREMQEMHHAQGHGHGHAAHSLSPSPGARARDKGATPEGEGLAGGLGEGEGEGEQPQVQEGDEGEEEWEEEAVLKDDDRELDRVFEILSTVRNRFFEEHEANGSADVASIIPSLKRLVLRDTSLVFSGLVALGTAPHNSEYWKLAASFGAHCSAELSSSTTHLVAAQEGTAKVHQARRMRRDGVKVEGEEGVRIVYPQWLLDCVARWERLPEEGYLVPEPEGRASAPGSPVRPELSAGEDDAVAGERRQGQDAGGGEGDAEGEGEAEAELEGELHLEDLDWGDAMKEVDDLLLETDDDDTASLFGGAGGATDGESDASVASPAPAAAPGNGAARSPRKRPRGSTPTGAAGVAQDGPAAARSATESPLQKRVKTARSRKSGLKQSLSAAALERAASIAAGAVTGAGAGGGTGGVEEEEEEGRATPSEVASVASSSIASDDEDLLAMAADLEQGWT